MPVNRLLNNRLRGFFKAERKRKSQPIPQGFSVCPVGVVAGMSSQQVAQTRSLYEYAYAAARQNVIPFYLRPVLGTGN
jgi:hypothetical protein